jgi:glycosyltransferase involved in cell wall biosynthesis
MISIIITTKNEEKNIGRLLKSIFIQYNRDKHEIIVIDNFSTDRTCQIISRYNEIKLFSHGPERSAQRNFGIQKSKENIVLILDADMEISPNLLDNIEKDFKTLNCDGLYIEEKILCNGIFGYIRKLERKFYIATNIDCARVFKKQTLLKVGCYDENLTGPEDWDLDNKILTNKGHIKLLNNSKAYINHYEVGTNIINYLKKKKNYSLSYSYFKKKWRGSEYLKKQLGVCYRLFFVFIEDNKYKIALKQPLIFVLMYLVVVLKAVVVLKNYLKK